MTPTAGTQRHERRKSVIPVTKKGPDRSGPSNRADMGRYGVMVNENGTERTGFAGSLLCTQTLPL